MASGAMIYQRAAPWSLTFPQRPFNLLFLGNLSLQAGIDQAQRSGNFLVTLVVSVNVSVGQQKHCRQNEEIEVLDGVRFATRAGCRWQMGARG